MTKRIKLLIIMFLVSFVGQTASAQETGQQTPEIPKFEVITVEDISTGVKARLRIAIVIPKAENQEDLVRVAEKLTREAMVMNPHIDGIAFYFYTTSDANWLLGTGTWAPGGDIALITEAIAKYDLRTGYEIDIKFDQNAVTARLAREKDEERFGLSEQKRREINTVFVKAEERAEREARRKFPTNLDCVSLEMLRQNAIKRPEYVDELTEQYNEEVRKQYGISKEIDKAISKEAFIEQWPYPEYKPPGSGC